MWGWQPTRLGPACRRGCPRPPSGSAHGPTEPRPVREQEGALWCLLKSQVSLHVCGQGSWKREAGAGRTPRPGGWHQSVCGRPGGVSLQAAKSLGPGITEKANFRKDSVKTNLVLSMWLKTHFEKNWTKLIAILGSV